MPALFPWKIEGRLVCNQCYGDVDLPQETMDHITIEEFKDSDAVFFDCADGEVTTTVYGE